MNPPVSELYILRYITDFAFFNAFTGIACEDLRQIIYLFKGGCILEILQ